ncbi:MAG TPA: hypothetical protein VGP63_19355 [Planctomycetaceae bacterium]|jgi:hypothetical protein|nr:hypothetical protein [Planctomycetaceae bacterium]
MQRRAASAQSPVLVLALGVVVAAGTQAFAARYVPISISINGKIVMKSGTGDNGSPGPDVVWRYLKNAKLESVKGFSLEPDRDDPLRATLSGNVVLDVAYAGRADVAQLKLVRAAEDGPWQVAPAEIERTFKSRHKPFVFRVSIAGQPKSWTVLRTRTGPRPDDFDNVWQELKRLTIYGKKIEPDADDPLHATLTSGVTISLLYAEKTWGQAEVPQLKLSRDRPTSLWKIDPADFERLFQNRTKPE